jgi:hypothetical protein
MPKGRPNKELERRKTAKQLKEEKHRKINIIKTTDIWKEVVDNLIIEEPRPIDKTLPALAQIIESKITIYLFDVSKPVITTTQIKEYLTTKYQEDIYIKNGSTFISEVHLKNITDEELKEIWDIIN